MDEFYWDCFSLFYLMQLLRTVGNRWCPSCIMSSPCNRVSSFWANKVTFQSFTLTIWLSLMHLDTVHSTSFPLSTISPAHNPSFLFCCMQTAWPCPYCWYFGRMRATPDGRRPLACGGILRPHVQTWSTMVQSGSQMNSSGNWLWRGRH